ncbi:MAG UNVERIFIED_CONTAM: ParB/RepB/Spo0J family partition protein [Planctomycetaceae bacterium]|jgi:ParB family chromosome partitioning protein
MEAQASEQAVGPNFLKRRLGRGLSALLGSGDAEIAEQPAILPMHVSSGPPAPGADEISLELIERNPHQPRREFDQAAIDELSESIRRHGVLQPLIVRPRAEGGYQLVAGERRWRAAQQAGLEAVPCRVIDFSDRQSMEVALEENLKREDLNVLEKAGAFREYLERFGGTIEDLARQLSMSRASLSNMLRLLELAEPVQAMLRGDRISAGHGRALLALPVEQQEALSRQIETEQLSVRRTEELVREMVKASAEVGVESAGEASASSANDAAAESNEAVQTNHVLSLQTALRDLLGAKIDIRQRRNNAGQIVIHFTDNDDFERILGRLRKSA